MRNNLALIGSLAGFFAIYLLLDFLAKSLGIPTFIDYGDTITVSRGSGRMSYDDEVSGNTTDVGFYVLIASGMLAWRLYHWILSGSPSGGLSKKQLIIWFYWLAGLTAYILLATPLWLLPIPGIVQLLFCVAIAAGVGLFFFQKCTTKLSKLKSEDPGS